MSKPDQFTTEGMSIKTDFSKMVARVVCLNDGSKHHHKYDHRKPSFFFLSYYNFLIKYIHLFDRHHTQ